MESNNLYEEGFPTKEEIEKEKAELKERFIDNLTDEEIDTFFPDNEEARQVVENVFNETLRELETYEFDIDPFMVLYEPMKHRLIEELDKLGVEY
jgi:hypothetical protein